MLIKRFVKSYKPRPQTPQSQETISGDGFIILDFKESSPKSDYTKTITLDSSVRENAGIHPSKEVRANLQWLSNKHKEIFNKPSDVFKLINEVKDNPTHFYTNNKPNIALIGKFLHNGELGKIGIQKDYNSNFLQIRHATKASNGKRDNQRLLNRGGYPLAEWSNSTQLTSAKSVKPTTNGAKAHSKDNEQHYSTDSTKQSNQESSIPTLPQERS